MYNREKEFIRWAFMEGALDVGRGFETIKAFVDIMSGEMEALVAIEHSAWLEPEQVTELIAIAKPTRDSLRELKAWKDGIKRGRKRRPAKSVEDTTNGQ